MVSPSSRPVQHEGPAGALGTEGREPPGAGTAARSPAAECGIRTSRRGVPHPPRACARRRLDEILMLYTVRRQVAAGRRDRDRALSSRGPHLDLPYPRANGVASR
ncbi:hypothetical protein FM106_15565 [Brachybacterium faecium]|nr:hypothetical protein FM106_15565 [Brachybacterium faecium]